MMGGIDPVIAAAAAGAGLIALAGRGIFAPRSRLLCPVVSVGASGPPGRVALTFDDGPWPGSTEAVLELLEQRGIAGTFFVIGAYARRWPELVQRIDAGGHLVGNHSDEHLHWGAMRHRSYWRREIDGAAGAVFDAIGRRPLFFRPPLGYKNPFMGLAARERGNTMITWSNRGLDGIATTPDRIVERVLGRAAPGQIIALHDGVDPHRRRDPTVTVAALGPILEGLAGLGLRCERLDRLIAREAYPATTARPSGRQSAAASSA